MIFHLLIYLFILVGSAVQDKLFVLYSWPVKGNQQTKKAGECRC